MNEQDHFELFEPIISRTMMSVFSPHFDNLIPSDIYLDDIYVNKLSEDVDQIEFKVRIAPNTSHVIIESADSQVYGFDVYDGDFVNTYATSYNDISIKLSGKLKKIFSYKYLDRENYNIDDYVLKLVKYEMKAQTRYYLDKDHMPEFAEELSLSNEILIKIIVKETDTTAYKPGGEGYAKSLQSFNNRRR